MIVSWSGLMFGDPFHIIYLDFFFKLFDNVGKVIHADTSDGIPCLFVFFDPALVLRARAVTNPFPELDNFTFDSEDVVSILFRLSNFYGIFKVTQLSLPLIYFFFLTLRRPQFFMFTDSNKYYLPVNFTSQNVFRVEQPLQIDGGVTTTRNFMLILWKLYNLIVSSKLIISLFIHGFNSTLFSSRTTLFSSW